MKNVLLSLLAAALVMEKVPFTDCGTAEKVCIFMGISMALIYFFAFFEDLARKGKRILRRRARMAARIKRIRGLKIDAGYSK